MSIEKDFRRSVSATLERVLALRDEIKLRAHLLNRDAQRELSRLETQVIAVEQRASREGEHASETLRQVIHELARTLDDFVATRVHGPTGLLTSVGSLMTANVRTCTAEDSLETAAQSMWNGDCGVVPVLGGDGRLVGVVTDRDVCMATYTQGKPPAELRVSGAMSKQVFTCCSDDSIASSLATMARRRVRRLPVVDGDGKLVGLLSLADVARWAGPLTNPEVDVALTQALAAVSRDEPRGLTAAAE